MRLLLSANDLTALFERSEPIAPKQFQTWLRNHSGCLVLTGTSVIEASIALLDAGQKAALQELQRSIGDLPVCYLKELAIFVEELGGALVAFGRGREPLHVDPYVAKWSDTLGVSLGKSYSSQGIAETVTHLWRTAPEALRHFHRYQEILAEELAAELAAPERDATSPELFPQRFLRYIDRQLKLHGFALPPPRTSAFADWVYSNPLRCPGLRLAFEVYQELLRQGDQPPPAERALPGLGHLHAIPYVDAITLAPPLFECCQSVAGALQQRKPAIPFAGLIHSDLRSVLEHQP